MQKRTWMDRLGSVPLPLVTSVGAVAAALAVQALASLGPPGWDWIKFGQDVVTNAFFAVVITAAAAVVQRYQTRRSQARAILGLSAVRLTLNEWPEYQPAKPPDEPPSESAEVSAPTDVAALTTTAAEFETLATKIDEAADFPLEEPQAPLFALMLIKTLRWPIVSLIGEAGRTRRSLYAAHIGNDLAMIAGTDDGELASAAQACRKGILEWAAAIQRTNAVVLERLLVERNTALLTWEVPRARRFFDAYAGADLHTAAVTYDPLYLLVFHIEQMCAKYAGIDQDESSDIPDVLDQLRRPLHALSKEARTAAACTRQLAALSELAYAHHS